MGISNKPFLEAYEDPDSPQFGHLAAQVSQQVRAERTTGALPRSCSAHGVFLCMLI